MFELTPALQDTVGEILQENNTAALYVVPDRNVVTTGVFAVEGWEQQPHFRYACPAQSANLPGTTIADRLVDPEPTATVYGPDEHDFDIDQEHIRVGTLPVLRDYRQCGNLLMTIRRTWNNAPDTDITTHERPARIGENLHTGIFNGREQLTLHSGRPPVVHPGLPHPPDTKLAHILACLVTGHYARSDEFGVPVENDDASLGQLRIHRMTPASTVDEIADDCSAILGDRLCFGLSSTGDSHPFVSRLNDRERPAMLVKALSPDPALTSFIAAQGLAGDRSVFVYNHAYDGTLLSPCREPGTPDPADITFSDLINVGAGNIVVAYAESRTRADYIIDETPRHALLFLVMPTEQEPNREEVSVVREVLPGWYRWEKTAEGPLDPGAYTYFQTPAVPGRTATDYPGLFNEQRLPSDDNQGILV